MNFRAATRPTAIEAAPGKLLLVIENELTVTYNPTLKFDFRSTVATYATSPGWNMCRVWHSVYSFDSATSVVLDADLDDFSTLVLSPFLRLSDSL